MAQELSLGISVGSFGFVIGFLSGYAVRAYLSLVHRKKRNFHTGIVATVCLLAMSQSAQAVSTNISAEAGFYHQVILSPADYQFEVGNIACGGPG